MDPELSPEKKPLSESDYDAISFSSIPLDDKCEKLLPDDYECNLVIADCGEECIGEECELRGGCGGGGGSGRIGDEGAGGSGSGGGGGGGSGGCSGCSGGGGCGGCEDSDDNIGGISGIGVDMAGVGQNNNDCDKKKTKKKKKNTKNKNYKVTIVQPTKDVSTKKGRKNSREPEIRDTNLVLSLFVLFCFNLPFGLLATMFSLMAGSAFKEGKKKKAKCHSRTSMVISLLGIATTAALVMCVIFFLAINEQSQGY